MIPLSSTSSVPVFDCHVLLRKPVTDGERYQVRCAAAPQVQAEGTTEREALQSLVIRFKYFIQEHQSQGQPIPWQEPEAVAEPGEVDRWVSVHL